MPEQIFHPDLPGQIIVAFQHLSERKIEGDQFTHEERAGSKLIRSMSRLYMGIPKVEVITEKYEKPKVFNGVSEISASFSHTETALSGALSGHFIVGCDMECLYRKVHERLALRMKHEKEDEELYKKLEPVRTWTLKEAALKMIGTGLRQPMNSVKIDPVSDSLFDVEFNDGKQAKICSFKYQEHWISICYQNTMP